MAHPVKVSTSVFASLQEEAAREGLTLRAVLQRRLDEGDRTVRELADVRAQLEDQLATLRAGLRTAGEESAQDKRLLLKLEKEQARLTGALEVATAKRDELVSALHEARSESDQLSSQLTTAKRERDRAGKTLSVLIGVLVVGSLITVGYLWLQRLRGREKQTMEQSNAAMLPYPFPEF